MCEKMKSDKKESSCLIKTSLKTCSRKVFCYLLKLIGDVLLGFVLLSTGLYILAGLNPSFYNILTRWANYPILPEIKSCRIDEILKETDISGMVFYRITVKIMEEIDGLYDVVFAVEDEWTSVYEMGKSSEIYDDNRNFVYRRIIFKDGQRENVFRFDISINHKEQNTPELKKNQELSKEECPIKAVPIRR